MTSLLTCPQCQFPMTVYQPERQRSMVCPTCRESLEATMFPAMFAPPEQVRDQLIGDAAESACFFHPQKRAQLACDGCGRFLCALCRLEIDGQSLCPACVESGIRKESMNSLATRRTNYDSIALGLATWPILLIWVSLLTAPAALYFAIRYFRPLPGPVKRTNVRQIVAIVLSLGQIGLWFFLLAQVLTVRGGM